MSIKKFKEYFKEQDEGFLVDEILTIYKTFETIKEYYDYKINYQNLDQIAQKYKRVLKKQLCPSRGFPELKYSIARRAISDFKKVCPNPYAIIDIQLTFVEYGVQCTLQYGDIDERFYNSMGSMFQKCLEDMQKYELLTAFEKRCHLIWEKTESMGWGFGDQITYLCDKFFQKSYVT